jgi:hypothetical protein
MPIRIQKFHARIRLIQRTVDKLCGQKKFAISDFDSCVPRQPSFPRASHRIARIKHRVITTSHMVNPEFTLLREIRKKALMLVVGT